MNKNTLFILLLLLLPSGLALEGHFSGDPVFVRVIDYDPITSTYTFFCEIPEGANPSRYWTVRPDTPELEFSITTTSPTLEYTLTQEVMYHIGCQVEDGGEYIRGDFHIDTRTGPNIDEPNIEALSTDGLTFTTHCEPHEATNYALKWWINHPSGDIQLSEFNDQNTITYTVEDTGLRDITCGIWDIDRAKWTQWGLPLEFFDEGPAYIPNVDGCMPYQNCAGMNLTLPPFKIYLDDSAPASDVTLASDTISKLELAGYEIPVGTVMLFSEVDGLDINDQVSLAIFEGEAVIVIGEPFEDSIPFALELGNILDMLGIPHIFMMSTDVESSDLEDLFPLTEPGICIPEGESYFLETGSDKLEIRENVGNVVDTVSEYEMPNLLPNQHLVTPEGETDVFQYLRFKDGDHLGPMGVNFVENDDDLMDTYLVVPNVWFFQWEPQFPSGLESELDSGQLEDLKGLTFNILGTDFNILGAEVDSDGSNFEMLLFEEGALVTLREGETRTLTVDGVDYEVTLIFVSDPGMFPVEVKFAVNGELTPPLGETETYTLSDGIQIAVRDILVNSREGVANFLLGHKKLYFTDPNPENTDVFDGAVELNDENLNDAALDVLGSFITPDVYEIVDIKYILEMDALAATTAYVPQGHGVREFMASPEGLLNDGLDIFFAELDDGSVFPLETAMEPLEINSLGDDEYDITFTNIQGRTYTFPLVSNENGVWKYGDDDDELIFVEGDDETDFVIGDDDYFFVSNYRGDDVDKSVTNVLRYSDYDNTDFIVEFTYLGTGSPIHVPILPDGSGHLVIGGHTYEIFVSDRTADSPLLAIDLDADGNVENDVVQITTFGGAVINLAENVVINDTLEVSGAALSPYVRNGEDLEVLNDFLGDQTITMTMTVLSKNFDTSDNGDGVLTWEIREVNPDQEVDLMVTGYSGPLEGVFPGEVGEFQFDEPSDDLDDWKFGMTDWGVMIKEYNPEGFEANELILEIPASQRLAHVAVTYDITVCPASPVCGDGNLDIGEQCDDGNVEPGDGCNEFCEIESSCFETVEDIPAECSGVITDDILSGGCRTIVCEDVGRLTRVLACNKPDNNNPLFFEMYRQTTIGDPLEICLADTCIQNNGFARSDNFPICIGPPVCTDADTDSFNVEGGVCGPIDCDDNDPNIRPDADDVCNGIDDDCDGEIDEDGVCGYECGNGILEEGEECDDGNTEPGDGCSEICEIEGATSIELRIAQWYPQGMNYVFICDADGFAPTSYDWFFGDGQKQLNSPNSNVWHTYIAPGDYTAECIATDGATTESDTLDITVA